MTKNPNYVRPRGANQVQRMDDSWRRSLYLAGMVVRIGDEANGLAMRPGMSVGRALDECVGKEGSPQRIAYEMTNDHYKKWPCVLINATLDADVDEFLDAFYHVSVDNPDFRDGFFDFSPIVCTLEGTMAALKKRKGKVMRLLAQGRLRGFRTYQGNWYVFNWTILDIDPWAPCTWPEKWGEYLESDGATDTFPTVKTLTYSRERPSPPPPAPEPAPVVIEPAPEPHVETARERHLRTRGPKPEMEDYLLPNGCLDQERYNKALCDYLCYEDPAYPGMICF